MQHHLLTNLNPRFDNAYALSQIEQGHNELLNRKPRTDADKQGPSKTGRTLPRLITLGGDHTITLPLLRSMNQAYGPISVIHFDSHLLVVLHDVQLLPLMRIQGHMEAKGFRRIANGRRRYKPWNLFLPCIRRRLTSQRYKYPCWYPYDSIFNGRL